MVENWTKLVLGWRQLSENLRFYFTATLLVYISAACDETAVFAWTNSATLVVKEG
jgi:hypothetical protein